MFWRRRDPEPEPATPAPRPRPAINGGGSWAEYEPPPPDLRMHLREKSAAPAPGAAVAAMFAAEFEAKEWGDASYAQFLNAPAEPPPPPHDGGLQIEPPPWQDALERGDLDLSALAPPPPPERPNSSALAELKAQLGDDEWPEVTFPAPPLAPIRYDPLPAPDWELEAKERAERDREERERQRREARAQLLQELADEAGESHQHYPAARKQATKEENPR